MNNNLKILLLAFIAGLSVFPLMSSAQENKTGVPYDSLSSYRTQDINRYNEPMLPSLASSISPIFSPNLRLAQPHDSINPLALQLIPNGAPRIATWQGGGITGFGGVRGIYLGRYQGMDINYGHWGIMVGVQDGFIPYDGQFRIMPMAVPYYQLNNGVKIGVDVGGMIYNAIQGPPTPGNPLGVKNYHGNAIIAPPIDTKPKFNTLETPKGVKSE